MASSTNFTEWSREEKDAFAQKRMQEMKLKNEMLMQRHAEVLEDKHKAESRNSSIKVALKKEKNAVAEEVQCKNEYEREWDRGKEDLELWNSPDSYDSLHNRKASNWRSDRREDTWTNSTYTQSKRSDWRTERREENWANSSYTQSKSSQQKYDDYGQTSFSNKKFGAGNNTYRSENRGVTGSNYERQNAKGSLRRPRGRGSVAFNSNERNRSNYSQCTEKKHNRAAHSSSSFSDPDTRNLHNSKAQHTGDTWSDDELAENQQKQSRVENWVNSINSTDSWDQGNDSKNTSKEKGKEIGNLTSSYQKLQHSYEDTWDNGKPASTMSKNQSTDRGFKQNSYSAHSTYKNNDNNPCDNRNYDKPHFQRQDNNRKSFDRNKKYVGQSSTLNAESHVQRFSSQANARGMHGHPKRESSYKSKYVRESDTRGDIEVDHSNESSNNWKQPYHTPRNNAKSNEGWMDSTQREYKSNTRVTHAPKNVNNEDDEWANIDQSHIFKNTNFGRRNVEKSSNFDIANNEYSNSWKQRSHKKSPRREEGWEHSAGKEHKSNMNVTNSPENVNDEENEWTDINESEFPRKTNSRRKSVEKGSNFASAHNKRTNSRRKSYSLQNNNDQSDEGLLNSTEQEYKTKKAVTYASNVNHSLGDWADIVPSDVSEKTTSQENYILEKGSSVYSVESEQSSSWKSPTCTQYNYGKSDEGCLDASEKEHMNKTGMPHALKNVPCDVDKWADIDQSELFLQTKSPVNAIEDSNFNHSINDDESNFMEGGDVKSYESTLKQMDYSDDGFIDDRESTFFEGKEVKLNGNDTIRVVIHLDNTSSEVQPLNNERNFDECVNTYETTSNLNSCSTYHDSVGEKITSAVMKEISNSEMSGISQDIIVDSEPSTMRIPEQFNEISSTDTKLDMPPELQNESVLSEEENYSKCEKHVEVSVYKDKNLSQDNKIIPVLDHDDAICGKNDNITDEYNHSTSKTIAYDEKSEFKKKNEEIPENDNIPDEDHICKPSKTFATDENDVLVEEENENDNMHDASTSNIFAVSGKTLVVEREEIPEKNNFKNDVLPPDMQELTQNSNAQIVLPDMLGTNKNSDKQYTSFSSVCKNDTEICTGDPQLGVQNDDSVCLEQLPKVCTENFSQSLMTNMKFPDLVPIFVAGFSVDGAHGRDKSCVKQELIESSQSNFEKHCDVIKEETNINPAGKKEPDLLQLKEISQADNENASALNQSDDGGWSTVSDEADSNAENSDGLISNADAI